MSNLKKNSLGGKTATMKCTIPCYGSYPVKYYIWGVTEGGESGREGDKGREVKRE